MGFDSARRELIYRANMNPVTVWVMRRFDARALNQALDQQRRERALSWDAVAREIGVSKSTILRTKSAGRMAVDGVLAMVAWLGVPVERFVRDGTHAADR